MYVNLQCPELTGYVWFLLTGGQRNWVQVICNGGIASMFAMIYMLDNGVGEMPVDFSKRYTPSFFSMAVMGALACSCGDTFASELGTVFKYNTQPRLITTFRKVPKGGYDVYLFLLLKEVELYIKLFKYFLNIEYYTFHSKKLSLSSVVT